MEKNPLLVGTWESKLGSIVVFFLVFFGLTMIVQGLTGAFFIHSLFSVLVGLVGAYWILTHYPVSFSIPLPVFGLSLFLFFLLVFPVLQTHGIAASADAATTIALRVMDTHIPATYAPYSNVSFTYQIGFPLLAKAFSDLLPFLADYSVIWLLAAVFGAFFCIIAYWFAEAFFSDQKIAILAALLVFASKLVFENFYWGEYAWLAATVFSLLALVLWKKNNPVFLLFIPVILLLHPAIAINFGVLALLLLLTKQLDWAPVPFAIAFGLLALPAFFFNYLVIFENLFTGQASVGFHFFSAVHNLFILPAWVGTGLSLLFFGSIILLFFRSEKNKSNDPIWLGIWLAVSIALFLLLSAFGTILANREIELVLFAMLFWTAYNISQSRVFELHAKTIFAIVLIIGLLSFSFSGSLVKSRAGSKMSDVEIDVALAFKELDPSVQPTIFLSKGGGKIAEIANKAPFDANASYLITTAEVLVKRNAAWDEFSQRHDYQEKIRSTHCGECILAIPGLRYAVIDSNFTPIFLDQPIVYEKGSFRIYRLR